MRCTWSPEDPAELDWYVLCSAIACCVVINLQNFTKQLLDHSQAKVIALSRKLPSFDLERLKCEYPSRLHIQQMDLEDTNSIEAAASAIKKEYSKINLLLNVSGVLYDDNHMPERSIAHIDPQWMLQSFQVYLK